MTSETRETTDYGPVSKSWQSADLLDLCVENGGVQTGPFGSQLHQQDYVEDGTPIITVEHLGENRIIKSNLPGVSEGDRARLRKYTLQPGDIVVSRVGSVDRRAFVTEEEAGWLFSGRCLRVRPDPTKIDPLFLSYFLGHPGVRGHLRRIAVGATMPSMNTKLLGGVRVFFPPKEDQQRVAWILSSLDDKIGINRRLAQTLHETSMRLWQSAFDGYRGERAPAGWSSAALADVCRTQYGYTASATVEPGGPKFLRVKDINKHPWIEWHAVPHCQISSKDLAKYRLSEGDILVARMADPGKSALIDSSQPEAVFASYLVRLTTENLASAYFIYGFLQSKTYRDYCLGAMGGSVQRNMNARVIGAARLTVPPRGDLDKYLTLARPLRRRMSAALHEMATLIELRDALLPRLVSGGLAVFPVSSAEAA